MTQATSNPSSSSQESMTQLAANLVREIASLVRDEAKLAKTELSQKADNLRLGLIAIISGAILFVSALNVLLGTVVIGLTNLGMSPGWAALAVGGITAGAAVGLVFHGMNKLDPESLMPKRTIRQVEADAELVKDNLP